MGAKRRYRRKLAKYQPRSRRSLERAYKAAHAHIHDIAHECETLEHERDAALSEVEAVRAVLTDEQIEALNASFTFEEPEGGYPGALAEPNPANDPLYEPSPLAKALERARQED